MTTEPAQIIRPILQRTYGTGPMVEGLVAHLVEQINTEHSEREVMLTCWDWFSGGTTAESVASEIAEALNWK